MGELSQKNSVVSSPARALAVWPVIHLDGLAAAVASARLVAGLGVAGVFLISMDGRDQDVIPAARAAREECPGLKVGVNLLGSSARSALEAALRAGLDATWTDSPGVGGSGPDAGALECAEILKGCPAHLFFASVAFKYQKAESDPGRAALEAALLGMVPTTSGAATGAPPTAEKLMAMRRALGAGPFAAASGLDSANVGELGASLTHALVSTGVSRSFHEFDPARLEAFMRARPRVGWGFEPRAAW